MHKRTQSFISFAQQLYRSIQTYLKRGIGLFMEDIEQLRSILLTDNWLLIKDKYGSVVILGDLIQGNHIPKISFLYGFEWNRSEMRDQSEKPVGMLNFCCLLNGYFIFCSYVLLSVLNSHLTRNQCINELNDHFGAYIVSQTVLPLLEKISNFISHILIDDW